MTDIPAQYRRLEGSERRPIPGARRVGPANPNEHFSVSIYVRPRPDGPPLPDMEHWMTPRRGSREFLSQAEFARQYGAEQADLDKVSAFARTNGLVIDEINAARRVVIVSGSVGQMNKAFGVDLGRYKSREETYRGREGHIHLPIDLADIVEGVFGLDNRRVAHPHAITTTPPQVAALYNFPPGNGTGQTIGIIALGGGFAPADINAYFAGLGLAAPTVNVIPVDKAGNTPAGSATNVWTKNTTKATVSDPDIEATLDIDVAGTTAPGAVIAVYFAPNTQQGEVDAFTTALTDTSNNPSVLSISWSGDENTVWTPSGRSKLSATFQAAAALGVTILTITGDFGSSAGVFDGKAHVVYPASDPWVTACGGTTIQNLSPYTEGTWNDASGATGGGISSVFGLPPYQVGAGVPPSINDGKTSGRGIPDLAGNASGSSGYDLVLYGSRTSTLSTTSGTINFVGPVGGTSAVAPFYAGLVATLNGLFGRRVGALAPTLYLIGKTPWLNVFRDIADGGNNSVSFTTPAGTPGTSLGYSAGVGWDACTGWGVADGKNLRAALILGRRINKTDTTPYKPAACVGIEGSGTAVQLFWRANDHSHDIYTSPGGGTDFPKGSPINGVDKTSKGPAACLFDNQIFVFWKSNDHTNAIFVSSSNNGVIWPPGNTINNLDRTPDTPAACIFLQHIFLFWQSNDSSNAIHFSSSLNGHVFPPGKKINGVDHTSAPPAACVFNGQIFLFWRADDGSNAIYVTSSPDGLKFPPGRKINAVDATPVSPAACVIDKRIFLFWKSNDKLDYIYWSVSPDGINWPSGQKINYPDSTPDSPVPVAFNNNLFLYWKADDSSNAIYAINWPFSLFK
jgi:Pro-kumamolisin, activation domain